MKAKQTSHPYRRKPASNNRTCWTWELEMIGALLVLVWFAGLVQFCRQLI